MKYKRSVSVFLAVLALIPAIMTAGCSEESHIITQHTSRPDGTATSKPYATNSSLTKDDITLTVSLLPYTEQVTGVTLQGFYYNAQGLTLKLGESIGVSNELIAECGLIEFESGLLIVIESRD